MQKLLCCLLPLLFSNGIYDYTLQSAQGGTINLSDYKGKKILIVNTASNSDKALQYARLEALYQQYKDSLVVIAVPSNSFGNEHDDDSILYEYVTSNYDITFPVSGKAEVAGDSICALYQWLTRKELNGIMNNTVNADFQKFLIDGSGNLVGAFSSFADPLCLEIKEAIIGNE